MMNARTTALLALDLAESRRVRASIATSAPWIPVPRIWTLDGHNAAREISQPVDYGLPEGAVVYVSAGVQRTPAAKFLAAVQRENGDDVEFRNLDRDGQWAGWESERPEPRRDVVEQGEDPNRPTGPAPDQAFTDAAVRGFAVPDPLTGAALPTEPPTPEQAAAEQAALDVEIGMPPEAAEAVAELVEQGVDVVDAVEAVTEPSPAELAEAAIANALDDDRLENLGGLDFAQALRDVLAENGWHLHHHGEPGPCADCRQGCPMIGGPCSPRTEGDTDGEAEEGDDGGQETRKATAMARPEPVTVVTWIYVRGAGWWDGPWQLTRGEARDDVGTVVQLADVSATSDLPLDGSRQLPGTSR